ncbi:MAG: F0F1 ATP synthase subunit gamma, partial [Candidatus Eremiobacteraeota bacterium]|nr:F0F1 ATP synthase subunit gamma [Candidatus Eremiobacteraeota bacterium]
TADKGRAGAFNANLIRAAEIYTADHKDATFFTVGNKARNAVRRMERPDHATWALNAPSKIDTARAVAATVSAAFVAGEIGDIVLISPKLVSMLSQKPETRKLVPIEDIAALATADRPASSGAVEFSPSPEFVLSRLLPKYLEFTIYSAMLETAAAFFAAQLIAMNNATDNAGKLIDELTIKMNNARQAAITKELLEIVAGAEALSGS